MECDYTHLKHNLLVSQTKLKLVIKAVIIKRVYYIVSKPFEQFLF
jgi:hypothetical protein